MLLFIIGVVVFLLSAARVNNTDMTNTYQVELSFLSQIIWAALAISSFNIEIYNDSLSSIQIYDYGYIGISLGILITSFLNTVVLLLYGSFNTMFGGQNGS